MAEGSLEKENDGQGIIESPTLKKVNTFIP